MEDGAFTPTTMSETLPEHNTMDFDLVEELFYDGCWLETTDGSSFWQPGPSTSSALNLPSYCYPTSGNNMGHLDPNPWQEGNQEELPKSNFSDNPPPVFLQTEQLDTSEVQNREAILTLASGQSETFLVEDTEMSRRLWIAPSRNLSSNSSVKKRLTWAIEYLKESTRDRDVLVQIWVPIKSRGKRVLTTNNQPFSLNPSYKNLADYRNVSRRYQFAVEENSKDMVGLPGRVFLKKLPDWTPDVRFFKREEYPRINDAQRYNVCGSLALPVFERGSGNCLGVVEIVTTTQKANYHPEFENICKALEAVDLRGSVICSPPKLKAWNESYQIALMEIQEVLTTVCNVHGLPLAQAWAPCIQLGKDGCRHANENYTACVSTIDSAYCAPSPQGLGFREACSEHHLLIGEGVAGEAFMTNQPCFAADITAFSKTEYRLSHHARMFGLHAAVAIRLRCIYTGSADFVLEFFLPLSCQNAEEHKQMLNSLSSVIQEVCRSLRVVTEQELQEETRFPVRETVTSSGVRHNEEVAAKFLPSSSREPSYEESSWIAHMMEAQQKGKGVAVSLQYPNDELKEEFKMTTLWDNSDVNLHHEQVSDQKQLGQDSGIKGIDGGGDFSSASGHCPPGARKAGEKRRMKTEKAVSLQVLRQYFSGSLKDAAKSIGVCPTTLKRICRQHGITRWPSRKIKKVSHSLRKLQLVIDSVQGAEGSIQLASFYTNFPELSPGVLETTSFTTTKTNDHLGQLNTQAEGSLLSPETTSSKSHSSSCNHSSSSSLCCSTGAKQPTITAGASGSGSGDALLAEKPTGLLLKRALSDAGLQDAGQEETKVLPRSHSHNIFGEHPNIESVPPLLKSSHHQVLPDTAAFRVKASFGEEKIRFRMQQDWSLGDLQREIAKRFSIGDTSRIDLKYLDDESEWVLLTCDDDLEECIDIHRSSKSHTIKLSLDFSSHPNLGSSFGSTSPS